MREQLQQHQQQEQQELTIKTTKMSDTHLMPRHFRYEGDVFADNTTPEMLDRVKTLQFNKTDLLLAAYPKSGKSWMSYLLVLLNNDGQERHGEWSVFEDVPYIEFTVGKTAEKSLTPEEVVNKLDRLPAPRLLGTHLPPKLLELRVRQGQMKVVVVIRNPKDTLVSYFHFYRMALGLGKFKGNWDQFFEEFKSDSLYSGNVIDYQVSWWRLRHLPNVLIVKYGDMKRDLGSVLRRVASFCEKNLSDQVLDRIAGMATFDKLQANPAANYEAANKVGYMDFTVSKFMKKGQVGDWKNYFSASQSDYVDRLCEQLATPIGLLYDFE